MCSCTVSLSLSMSITRNNVSRCDIARDQRIKSTKITHGFCVPKVRTLHFFLSFCIPVFFLLHKLELIYSRAIQFHTCSVSECLDVAVTAVVLNTTSCLFQSSYINSTVYSTDLYIQLQVFT